MKSRILLIPLLLSTFIGINVEAKNELDNLKYQNSSKKIFSQETHKLESFLNYDKEIKISNSGYSSSSDDSSDLIIGFLGFLGFFVLPLFWKPSRKAIGLMNIIIGAIVSLTGIGALIGIPMIVFGGILLFL